MGKDKLIIVIAALAIISALGVTTYYDSGGNILVNNTTHTITTDSSTKIIDERINENTTFVTQYQGNTPIRNMILSNDTTKTAGILTSESDKVLKFVTFPYTLPGTEITVQKYRCDFIKNYCGFWINATRGGQEVATNSPVWVYPPPYLVLVSESYNAQTNTLTTTLKEDPQTAVIQVLQRYVDQQPLGTRVVGTKE